MKKLLFLILTISPFLALLSQPTSLGFSVGYATFSMSKMKEINNHDVASNRFGAKITDDFPGNALFKVYFHHTFYNKLGLGIKVSLSSTGSKISAVDYSGNYSIKNMVHFISPGFIMDYPIYQANKWKLLIYNEFGWEFSSLSKQMSLITSENRFFDFDKYRSINLYTEPGLCLKYSLNENFYLGANLGYSIDTRNRLKHPSESFNLKELLDFRSVEYALNWSGLRIGVTVAATLNKASKKDKIEVKANMPEQEKTIDSNNTTSFKSRYNSILEAGFYSKDQTYSIGMLDAYFISGRLWTKHFYCGIGTGLHYVCFPGKTIIPLFLDMRFYLSDRKITPFLITDFGINFDTKNSMKTGTMAKLALGIRYKVAMKSALNLSFGYEIQQTSQGSYYRNNKGPVGLALGFSF